MKLTTSTTSVHDKARRYKASARVSYKANEHSSFLSLSKLTPCGDFGITVNPTQAHLRVSVALSDGFTWAALKIHTVRRFQDSLQLHW